MKVVKMKKWAAEWAATTCKPLHLNAIQWCFVIVCGMMLAACDDEKPLGNDGGEYMAYLTAEKEKTDSCLKVTKALERDVTYYLRTHSVIDNGFDIMVRYEKVNKQMLDSLSRRAEILDKAIAFQSLDLKAPKLQSQLAASIKEWLGEDPYSGEYDILGLPSGVGSYVGEDGEFYDGEWSHGKRSGVGLSVGIPYGYFTRIYAKTEPSGNHTDAGGTGLKLGEWKNDVFLGERVTYTPDRVYGIDISRYQHEVPVTQRVKVGKKGRKKWVTKKVMQHFPINWSALRITSLGTYSQKKIHGVVDYPVSFVYIKSTEGTSIRNAYYPGDYANSRKHGYKTGSYHFFSIRTSGSAQASFFLRNSRYSAGDLPPVLDIEPTDGQISQMGGERILFANVRAWLTAVEKAYGVKPVLYVSQRFVSKHLTKAPDIMQNYEVWIARYGEYRPEVNLISWQLCQDGRVRGIHGNVDISVMF